MGRSQWLLPVGLAVSLVLNSHPIASFGQQPKVPPPTVEDFQKQIKRFELTNPKPERLEAANWLDRHAASKNAYLASSALEQCLRNDPEADVRGAALKALAAIAEKRKEPCPLAIIHAMLDKDDSVYQSANVYAAYFSRFAPGAVDVLLPYAKSDNVRLRNDCLIILLTLAAKTSGSSKRSKRQRKTRILGSVTTLT